MLLKKIYSGEEILGFNTYTTDDSEYVLIDSQGFYHSKNINDFIVSLKTFITESNKISNTFIDMIYYCTDSQTQLKEQEINLITELEKIYDFEKLPLIIVHTKAYSNNFHTQFLNFVIDKYGYKFPVIKVLARKLKDKGPYGLKDLKIATKIKRQNNLDSSYYCKFIANVSKNIYNDYTDNILITKIKGIFINSKEESIEDMINKIFNMYRFEKPGKAFNNEQKFILNKFRDDLINNYNNGIDDFIKIVIKYNAESDVYYESLKNKISEEEMEARIEVIYKKVRRV